LAFDDHRLRQDQGRRRHIADGDAAVDARLVDPDRDAGLGECRTGEAGDERKSENLLHEYLQDKMPFINASRRQARDGVRTRLRVGLHAVTPGR